MKPCSDICCRDRIKGATLSLLDAAGNTTWMVNIGTWFFTREMYPIYIVSGMTI